MSEQTTGMNPALKVILIVVAVLGVLGCGIVAVAVVLVGRSVAVYEEKASVAMTQVQMTAIAHAIEQYRLERRTLPADLEALLGADGYLDSDTVPDDGWGNPFHYEPREDGTLYTLTSLGADGAEGGEDDDADLVLDADGAGTLEWVGPR